jgi:hypothetical protein
MRASNFQPCNLKRHKFKPKHPILRTSEPNLLPELLEPPTQSLYCLKRQVSLLAGILALEQILKGFSSLRNRQNCVYLWEL